MPELPAINLPAPVVIAPVAEKTYPHGYIVGMSLTTRDAIGADQGMTITLRPYSQATAELYPNAFNDQSLDVASIWNEAARSGLFAQVLGGIVTVANLMLAERATMAAIAAPVDPENPAATDDKAALTSQLSDIRTALQVS